MAINPDTEVVALGPWTRGLVNSVSEYSIPLDGLLTADDIDIDRDGVTTTRLQWSLIDSANYTSIFKHDGQTYAVRDGEVGVVGDASFTAIATVTSPLGWTVLDGDPVYTDFASVRKIVDGASEPLPSGYYVDDEEQEYQLDPLPGGSEVHYWQGRLLVVRGNSLIWSEPLRYGVYSQTRNFIRFSKRIFWAAPLPGGVYLGLRDSVVFLRGSDPQKFSLHTVGKKSAPGVAAVYDPRHTGNGGEPLALWFTDVGIAVGSGSGEVSYPQAENLKGIPLLPGRMVVEDDRVYIFTTEEH